jgi:crotonobetainyl-CoA:carnitine CoA-transferase CaiB-like acyl-CoA transferase
VAGGGFPAPGKSLLAGGSPRYQLYPTHDGHFVACGALEDHFWRAFTDAIGIDAAAADDKRDPDATRRAVAARIAEKAAAAWKPVLAAANCCATIVASLEEALRDPHFVERGLFDAKVVAPSGATLPALPLPIAPRFRDTSEAKPFCKLEGS